MHLRKKHYKYLTWPLFYKSTLESTQYLKADLDLYTYSHKSPIYLH